MSETLLERFIRIAAENGVETQSLESIKEKYPHLEIEEGCTKQGNVSVVRALSASAFEASALVDTSDPDALKCLMDTDTLIIIIDSNRIYSSMHEAYKEAFKSQPESYMLFISQESKTADIEKQLVSGMQGPKKLIFAIA